MNHWRLLQSVWDLSREADQERAAEPKDERYPSERPWFRADVRRRFRGDRGHRVARVRREAILGGGAGRGVRGAGAGRARAPPAAQPPSDNRRDFTPDQKLGFFKDDKIIGGKIFLNELVLLC